VARAISGRVAVHIPTGDMSYQAESTARNDAAGTPMGGCAADFGTEHFSCPD